MRGPPREQGVSQNVLAYLAADRIVPRHVCDLAHATTEDGVLFKEAIRLREVACNFDTPLSDETAGYAQELFEILRSLTWEATACRFDLPATEEIAIRRRMKILLVLLQGNEAWTYQTSFFRRLPGPYEPLPAGEYPDLRSQLVVALGRPGEYGEESIRVPIDHAGWKLCTEARDGGA